MLWIIGWAIGFCVSWAIMTYLGFGCAAACGQNDCCEGCEKRDVHRFCVSFVILNSFGSWITVAMIYLFLYEHKYEVEGN